MHLHSLPPICLNCFGVRHRGSRKTNLSRPELSVFIDGHLVNRRQPGLPFPRSREKLAFENTVLFWRFVTCDRPEQVDPSYGAAAARGCVPSKRGGLAGGGESCRQHHHCCARRTQEKRFHIAQLTTHISGAAPVTSDI